MGNKIQNLFEPFQVEFIQTDSCPIKAHKHTFFELVYIMSGNGVYHINDNKFNYSGENLFLVMPFDIHYTEVTHPTSFLFIRFNSMYLEAQKSKGQHNDLTSWIQKMEYIFQNSSNVLGCLINNPADKPLVRAVMEALKQEHDHKQTLHQELVQQLINTLITIVARNISLHIQATTKVQQNTSLDIIHYIHSNIYHPEKLKAESIASHFNISLNYISEYFKKHTNENLQQYIINYKLALAETRLRHSDMRLNEIAFELGFTDESHLTKTFKKHKGITPSAFRKKLSESIVV